MQWTSTTIDTEVGVSAEKIVTILKIIIVVVYSAICLWPICIQDALHCASRYTNYTLHTNSYLLHHSWDQWRAVGCWDLYLSVYVPLYKLLSSPRAYGHSTLSTRIVLMVSILIQKWTNHSLHNWWNWNVMLVRRP